MNGRARIAPSATCIVTLLVTRSNVLTRTSDDRRCGSSWGGHPNIAAYLGSERRMAFNEHGIFRHYPELDETA